MDYEKAYRESFEAAKSLHEAGNALTKRQMEIVFPELRESEDERIRKWIVNYIHRGVFDEEEHPNALKAIAWLEKQKEQDWNKKPCLTCQEYEKGHKQGYTEGCTAGYNKAMEKMEQKEPNYTKRNALFDKCVENCDPEIMKRVSDEVDEMLKKEQKPFNDTQEYLKGVDRVQNYKELTKFEKGFDRIADTYAHRKNKDGYNQPWYTKERAAEMLYWAKEELGLLDEQKQAQSDIEREYVRTLKSLISDFLRGKEEVDREYYQQIFDWLDGRHIEQKFAEKQDYSGLTDLERAIHRGFLSAGVENAPVTIIKETAQECLAQMKSAEWDELQSEFKNINKAFKDGKKEVVAHPERYGLCKPAEWSEEDERILTGIIERGSSQVPFGEPALRGEQMEWLMNRLKSLRPQPHWKPSEEQMDTLLNTEGMVRQSGYRENAKVLASLYEQLKQLM